MRLVSMLPITKKSPIKLYAKKKYKHHSEVYEKKYSEGGIKQQLIANGNKNIDRIRSRAAEPSKATSSYPKAIQKDLLVAKLAAKIEPRKVI
jgi:hypothetical protein